MSPEQASGVSSLGPQSDQFSLGIVLFELAAHRRHFQRHTARITPFASEAEIETMPAWSPKGDRIAYVADVNGILQIFTKALGPSTPTQMTREKSWCHSPAWSEDGTRIYFLNGEALYSVAVAGGQRQLVLSGFARAVVSPDGKSLAALIHDADDRSRLAFSSPLRTYVHPAIAGLALDDRASSFAFTQDGRYMGLIADNRGKPQFWRIPVAGGTPRKMAYSGQNFTFFAWLRDGKRIVTAFVGSQYSPSFIANLRTGASYPRAAGTRRSGSEIGSTDRSAGLSARRRLAARRASFSTAPSPPTAIASPIGATTARKRSGFPLSGEAPVRLWHDPAGISQRGPA